MVHVFVDMCTMEFLHIEFEWNGKVWGISDMGIKYSARWDWFMGRLAKYRLLSYGKPFLAI